MCGSSWEEDSKALDKYVTSRIANTEDENIVNKFSDALMMAHNKSLLNLWGGSSWNNSNSS